MKKIKSKDPLEMILAELADNELKPGEFTTRQLYEKHVEGGGKMGMNALQQRVKRLYQDGNLKSRKVVIGGKMTNAYSLT